MGFEKNENRRTGKKMVSRSDTENPSDGAKATGEVAMTGLNGPGSDLRCESQWTSIAAWRRNWQPRIHNGTIALEKEVLTIRHDLDQSKKAMWDVEKSS